jgi:1-acyl-sn-glycerol-3-phosphate acyltransferase
MKSLLRKVYLYYCLFIFTVFFFVFFPLFLGPIFFKSQFHLVGIFNRWWAKLVLTFCFLPYSVECHGKLDPKKQYIFCPNHFSYVDIPTMGLNPHNAIFVGKHDMERVPLFGWMYRSLHITVDRNKLKSRYATFINSQRAIDEGKSLVVFPEGGIMTTEFPRMSRFKDGAFRLAIEKQIPIVPVTIATNWILLPGDWVDLKRHPIRVIFHEPIEPDPSRWTITTLKEEVFRIIDKQLRQEEANYLKHVN